MMTVVGLSRDMQLFNKDNVSQIFRSRYIRDTFNQNDNKTISEMLADPANCLITIRSKAFEG